MGNKHSTKTERKKKKFIRATSPGPMISRRYDLDMSKAKVIHRDHNGFESTPKFSYVYKGVPGGWYV
jgi:hypothetical protein